jgi:AcrR family transcriptional regulator
MNAATTTGSRQTADERRDAIIVAALHAFAQGGYSGTSTESIARAVGVSQPYLFQLFGTKRELFLAVVRHGFQRTRLVFHEAARRGPTDDQACTILDLMGQAYMRLLSDRDLLRVQLQAYAACGDEDVRQVVREEFAALFARGVKQLRHRFPRREVRHGDGGAPAPRDRYSHARAKLHSRSTVA